jgi:CheY-like chemotaxis protein
MAAHIPIVVLSGMEDTQTTTEAIINGAQDYLIKGELESKLLSKTIRYSIERKRNLERIKQSNERYTMVSNATIGVVWDVNLSNNEVVRSGDTFLHTHGYEENLLPQILAFGAKESIQKILLPWKWLSKPIYFLEVPNSGNMNIVFKMVRVNISMYMIVVR